MVHLTLEARDCGPEEKSILVGSHGIAVFDPNINITLLVNKHNK